MGLLKRLCLYLFIILLSISIYKDVTGGLFTSEHKPTLEHIKLNHLNASIIKIKVEPGDTVLSITEQINDFTDTPLNLQQILTDFKHYNPNINPNDLHVNEFYYFLKYDNA